MVRLEHSDQPKSPKSVLRPRSSRIRRLQGRVALVTGASRGAGRAIAAVLGEHGAIVYVTGRSVRGKRTTDNLPGTIEETAEEVTRRGGQGVAVRCDHAKEAEVQDTLQKIQDEQGRLDILVNNAWGGYEGERLLPTYFWQSSLKLWSSMFERGVKTHLLSTYFAIPLMIKTTSMAGQNNKSGAPGLILSTVAWDKGKYIGSFYDVAKHSVVRFLWGLAFELRPHRIATIALAPGFMRTERVMSYANGEADWKKVPWLKDTESPEYAGRAVAALATDETLMRKSGKAFHVGELARQYGFTDVDGRRVPEFIIRERFVDMVGKFQKRDGS